jgi:uncharacterized protein YlxW (UPF0749 family)
LNLRPPGYEPGELPDCSTPRRDGKDSIGLVPWWTWTALVVFSVVVAAGAAVTTAALFQLRRLANTSEDLADALEELNAKAEALQTRLEQAEERSEDVDRKLAMLDASFERLSVLLWALGDVRRTISHVTDAVTLRK